MSEPLKFDSADWKKIVKGAMLAASGCLVTYVASEVVPQIPQDTNVGAMIGAITAVLLNIARKYLANGGGR